MNNSGPVLATSNMDDGSFCILHRQPSGTTDAKWRDCLARSDLPMHYTAPEYFLEPALREKRPFAILSMNGDDVTAVMTGIHDGPHVRSGLSVRPQIAFSRGADRQRATRNMIAGLLREAQSAKLLDLYMWSDMDQLFDHRFRRRQCKGVVMLDLGRGPDALFREFSQTRRTDVRRAIRMGVSVDMAGSSDDLSGYYAVYLDWARRKTLPVMGKDEFQETFALTGNRRLFLARYESRIVAGLVLRFFPGGVAEYSANSSLERALHLRPNDLLQWRAIEWACAEGMTKYSLGGVHLFLRKSGGEVVPTARYRLDLSIFRRYAIGDWIADKVEEARPLIPERMVALGHSLRDQLWRFPLTSHFRDR